VRFFQDFGKPPAEAPKPLLSPKWRMPVYISMIVVGSVGLVLLVWLFVLPAARSQGAASRAAKTLIVVPPQKPIAGDSRENRKDLP
jgi:hypothetical protein